jgi:tetratricopeptide (TPR) repeat protein
MWQKGIQDMLVTDLSNSPDELKVRQTEPTNTLIQSQRLTNYASMTPSLANTISKKLDANVFIYGSIKQAGTKMRVNAELIETKTKEALKTFEIEDTAKEEKVFLIIDSLKTQVKNFLVISKLKKGIPLKMQRYGNTYSPEAYRLFLNGNEAVGNGDPATGVKLYKEAFAIDSNFVAAKIFMVAQSMYLGLFTDAKALCLKIYKERDHIPMIYRNNINWLYACLFETPREAIKYLRQELQSFGDWPVVYYLIGSEYLKLHQYDKAIPEFEKGLKLEEEWDENPGYGEYASLGFACHKTGQYKKERKLYRKAMNYYPDNPYIIFRQAVLALSEEMTKDAIEYIEKYKSIRKENSVPEASIMTGVADIYSDANILDKAEEYYRQALLLEPEKSVRMNNLAWFLIDKGRNIDAGLKLIDKALKLFPESWAMLDTKGWGFYKQGKYQEALKYKTCLFSGNM